MEMKALEHSEMHTQNTARLPPPIFKKIFFFFVRKILLNGFRHWRKIVIFSKVFNSFFLSSSQKYKEKSHIPNDRRKVL